MEVELTWVVLAAILLLTRPIQRRRAQIGGAVDALRLQLRNPILLGKVWNTCITLVATLLAYVVVVMDLLPKSLDAQSPRTTSLETWHLSLFVLGVGIVTTAVNSMAPSGNRALVHIYAALFLGSMFFVWPHPNITPLSALVIIMPYAGTVVEDLIIIFKLRRATAALQLVLRDRPDLIHLMKRL
jgi:hypothetical protein